MRPVPRAPRTSSTASSSSGRERAVPRRHRNPATGEVIARFPDSDAADVDAAVAAARAAFPAWSRHVAPRALGASRRDRGTHRAHAGDLAALEAIDTASRSRSPAAWTSRGRSPTSASSPAPSCTRRTECHATDDAALNYTLRRPRGVAGLISPWNLPLYLLTWKVAPALATGNTVVAKPSRAHADDGAPAGRDRRRGGAAAGRAQHRARLGREAGAALVAHPDVPPISFTGGTATGARDRAQRRRRCSRSCRWSSAARTRTSCSPTPTSTRRSRRRVRSRSRTRARSACAARASSSSGRSTTASSSGSSARAAALRIGDPLDPATDHGALVCAAHRDKVDGLHAPGARRRRHDPRAAAAARRPARALAGGFFLEPTVITGLGARVPRRSGGDLRARRDRHPVRPRGRGDRDRQRHAVRAVGVVWTRDLSRAHRVAAALDSGIVWVNCWLLRDLRVPFGGMKASGVGREGGEESLDSSPSAERLREAVRRITVLIDCGMLPLALRMDLPTRRQSWCREVRPRV